MESVQPMLARLAREIPLGDFLYEPKSDGFLFRPVLEMVQRF